MNIFKNLVLALLLLGCLTVKSQSEIPYFNFRQGFGFATPDSSYSLNIGFRMQQRALVNTISDDNLQPDSYEARVRRCRLIFRGHVVDPRLTYYLQLSFSRGDMDWEVNDLSEQNVSPNVVRDAVIYYRLTEGFQVGFGQTKLPGNRQRVNSSGALQFFDRSIVNAVFTTDRDFGFFASHTIKSSGAFVTKLKGAVTTGEGRNSSISNEGLAYTARVEFLPFGEFTDNGDYFEGDLIREEKPKLSICGGYMLNDLAVRTGGQLGDDLYGEKSFNLYMADILFKYKGFAWAGEYIRRDTDNPFVKGSDGKTRYIATGDGINNQISYCLPSRWEFALRYALVSPHRDVLKVFKQTEQYVAGVSKYLNKHKVKLQFNVVYNKQRNLATQSDHNWLSGVFQFELGI